MAPQTMEILPNSALASAREARQAKLAKFEAERIARAVLVPTADADVRRHLRARGLPVCLFGEDAHDRRQRLRGVLALEKMAAGGGGGGGGEGERERKGEGAVAEKGAEGKLKEEKREEYFTEGSEELKRLRAELVEVSVRKGGERVARERFAGARRRKREREREAAAVGRVRGMEVVSSQVGSSRPLSAICVFDSPAGGRREVVTGSWGGDVRVWAGDGGCEERQRLDVHDARVSTVRVPREWGDVLLTAAADGTAAVCVRAGDAGGFAVRARLVGHVGRVGDVAMHPWRKGLLASGGFDGELRLWDGRRVVARQESGHEQVYRVGFHPDGGVLGSCGLEGGVRMWDLRSGRAVVTMGGAHKDGVLGIEFCGDGRRVVTGGRDHVVRVWDLRMRRCEKVVAAHRGLVSAVRMGGEVLFSASFDRSVKCWGAKRGWSLLAAVTSFEDKVTAVDCSAGGEVMVTGCYDRTWKMWSGAGG